MAPMVYIKSNKVLLLNMITLQEIIPWDYINQKGLISNLASIILTKKKLSTSRDDLIKDFSKHSYANNSNWKRFSEGNLDF